MLDYDDLTPGRIFEHGDHPVTVEEIKAFAQRYDPQPFHLDEDAAERSFFRGLAASGWHTAAMTMRLMVDSGLKPEGGLIGAGVEKLKWFRPVRPGEVLRVRIQVLERRPMSSRPDGGLAKLRIQTLAGDDPVQEMECTIVVPRRLPEEP